MDAINGVHGKRLYFHDQHLLSQRHNRYRAAPITQQNGLNKFVARSPYHSRYGYRLCHYIKVEKERKRIGRLITKYLEGSLTPDDNRELDLWKCSSRFNPMYLRCALAVLQMEKYRETVSNKAMPRDWLTDECNTTYQSKGKGPWALVIITFLIIIVTIYKALTH